MSQIKIDLDVVEQLNGQLNSSVNKLSNLTNSVTSLGTHVDSAIATHRNIRSRLHSSNQSLHELETKLRGLQSFITNAVDRYNRAEYDVAKQAALLGDNRSTQETQSWWETAAGDVREGLAKLEGIARHAVTEGEIETSLSGMVSHAAKDALDIVGEVLVTREKVIDYIENAADQAIHALEDSAIGSFVEGAADAIDENITFGLLRNETTTTHKKSYEAGRIIGDLASEAAGIVEGVAGGAGELLGIGLDGTGIGAIAGVGLNIAGVAAIGHASSVMYNGASNLGKDASDLVQSFKGGASEGTGKVPEEAPQNADEADMPPNRENPPKEPLESEGTGEVPTKTFVDNPFDKTGTLKPNVKYKAGEHQYDYETDHLGRIEKFSTDELKLTTREERLPHDSNTPGKEIGDHAGHLAGDRFGGSPEIDNLVSQSSNVNLSEYKKIENEWAKALQADPPKHVSVDVKVNYDGDSLRPSGFKVTYEIDGRVNVVDLLN